MGNNVSTISAPKGEVATRLMRTVHIYSAMPVLLSMIFFAVTGIYLNHPDLNAGGVVSNQQSIALPEWGKSLDNWDENYPSHSLALLQWLDRDHDIRGVDFELEWDDFDKLLIINLSSPKGSTLIEVFVEDNLAEVDHRALSPLSMLNNVHRAKHVTGMWRFLSDLSAVCMLLFCLSGFWLMLSNRLNRTSANTSFLVGSGVFFLAIYLMH